MRLRKKKSLFFAFLFFVFVLLSWIAIELFSNYTTELAFKKLKLPHTEFYKLGIVRLKHGFLFHKNHKILI